MDKNTGAQVMNLILILWMWFSPVHPWYGLLIAVLCGTIVNLVGGSQ